MPSGRECRTCGERLPLDAFGTYMGRSGRRRALQRRRDCNECRRETRRAIYMHDKLVELGAAEDDRPKWR